MSNLDALHDHLSVVYPGMKAPSFRVSDREEDGALILHYHSSREGLEYIVIGLVRAIARKLLHTEINVEIIKQKEHPGDDVQFAIKEIHSPEISPHCIKQTACARPSKELVLLSSEPKISPATFCNIFPFHLMFGRDMEILQNGDSLSRVIKGLNGRAHLRMPDIFELVRPKIEFNSNALLAHINTVFALRTRPGCLQVPNSIDVNADFDSKSLRLKGQILYLEEFDNTLFLCSPSVSNLDDLRENNLYLSDIPVHDVTRNLILLSEQFQEDRILTKEPEILTDKLQQTHRDLAEEKKLTDLCEPEPGNDFCDVMTFVSLWPIRFHDRMKLECSSQRIPRAVVLGLLELNCDWLKIPTSQKSFPGSGSQTLFSAETSDSRSLENHLAFPISWMIPDSAY